MEKNGRVFVTFFPLCENIHLTKDIGMMPFIMARDHGYTSYIICYKNGDYPYLDREVSGVGLIFLKRGPLNGLAELSRKRLKNGLVNRAIESACIALDSLPVLLRHGKNIDVLQLYHLKDESLTVGWLYRLINPKGLLYLKLDISSEIIAKYEQMGPDSVRASRVYESLRFDLMSAESVHAVDVLRSSHLYFKDKGLCYIPNGIDVRRYTSLRLDRQKEPLVLHVGRIGNVQKGTDIALEAFARVAPDFPGWRLMLVGPVESDFEAAFEKFRARHPGLVDQIVLVGYLDRREDLFEYYARASLLLMPSRFEGFSLASLEAAYMGDQIIGSDLPAIRALTGNGGYGRLCPAGDIDSFAQALREMMAQGEDELGKRSGDLRKYIVDNFDWSDICSRLDTKLRQLSGRTS